MNNRFGSNWRYFAFTASLGLNPYESELKVFLRSQAFKVVFVGNSGSGKACLMRNLCGMKYDAESHLRTRILESQMVYYKKQFSEWDSDINSFHSNETIYGLKLFDFGCENHYQYLCKVLIKYLTVSLVVIVVDGRLSHEGMIKNINEWKQNLPVDVQSIVVISHGSYLRSISLTEQYQTRIIEFNAETSNVYFALESIRKLINTNIRRYSENVPLCIFISLQDIYNKFIGSNSNINSSGDIYLNWKYSNDVIKQAHDDWKHLTYLPNPAARAIVVNKNVYFVIRVYIEGCPIDNDLYCVLNDELLITLVRYIDDPLRVLSEDTLSRHMKNNVCDLNEYVNNLKCLCTFMNSAIGNEQRSFACLSEVFNDVDVKQRRGCSIQNDVYAFWTCVERLLLCWSAWFKIQV